MGINNRKGFGGKITRLFFIWAIFGIWLGLFLFSGTNKRGLGPTPKYIAQTKKAGKNIFWVRLCIAPFVPPPLFPLTAQ